MNNLTIQNNASVSPKTSSSTAIAMGTSSIDALAEVALRSHHRSPLLSASVSPASFGSSLPAQTAAAQAPVAASTSLIADAILRSSLASMGGISHQHHHQAPAAVAAPSAQQNARWPMLGGGSLQPSLLSSVGASSAPFAGQQPQQQQHAAAMHNGHQAFVSVGPSSTVESATAPSRRRKPNFAEKLHAVLSNRECRGAVAWLPSGRSFCITDQAEFVSRILPKYFREAKFESFSRRLKRWGFRKVYTTGLSQIIFSHDMFHRDRPDLCRVMNGREKVGAPSTVVPAVNSASETRSQLGASSMPQGQGPFVSQENLRDARMLQQAQVQHLTFQQQHQLFMQHQALQQRQAEQQRAMQLALEQRPNLSSASVPGRISYEDMRRISGCGTPPDLDLGAQQSMLSQANKALDPSAAAAADPGQSLKRLNDDIASCEEQLAILAQLKNLKERRRELIVGAIGGVASPGSSLASSPSLK